MRTSIVSAVKVGWVLWAKSRYPQLSVESLASVFQNFWLDGSPNLADLYQVLFFVSDMAGHNASVSESYHKDRITNHLWNVTVEPTDYGRPIASFSELNSKDPLEAVIFSIYNVISESPQVFGIRPPEDAPS